ncbi:MAG: site-specific integrase [Saprospiraceae bacterium]|nr:site-specific integrase [Saprospiraceae bacterium]
MIYRLHNQRSVISTGLSVQTALWNKNRMRLSERGGNIDAINTNRVLNHFEQMTRECESALLAQHGSFHHITAAMLKSSLESKLRGDTNQKDEPKLLDYIETFILHCKSKPQDYSTGAIKGFNTLVSLFNKFPSGKSVFLREIDYKFYDRFQKWMFDQDYSSNYVHKQWSRLKTILKSAAFDEYMEYHKPIWDRLPVSKKPTDSIYLTEDELDELAECDLTKNKRLEKVRDVFLVGCYTGLRFSDLVRVEEKYIVEIDDKLYIQIVPKKTNDKVTIPLKPYVRKILLKYGKSLPKISNQKMNEYLKEISQMAGLTNMVSIRKYPGGVKTEVQFEKWQLVTSHCARRSMATNLYKRKESPATIMQITGHRTVRAFMEYIKIGEEEGAKIMASNAYFS